MSEPKKERRGKKSIEKKHRENGVERKKKVTKKEEQKAVVTSLSLLAAEGAIDPTLSSLFAAKVSMAVSHRMNDPS